MKPVEVLCIDSDPGIRKLLQRGLQGYGYKVIAGSSYKEASDLVARFAPDMLVLELTPEWSVEGLSFCRDLRKRSTTPIIMISTEAEKAVELAALDAGADDYLTKPFNLQSLEARMRAVLRRVVIEESGISTGEIQIDDLTINLVKHRVMLQNEEVHLTPTEYELVRVLATHAGTVLTHHALSDELWPGKAAKPDHYFTVYINSIRKKLRKSSATSSPYIITEPGVGYRFVEA